MITVDTVYVHLRNTTNGHYKFYKMYKNQNDFTVKWGRIGSVGKETTYPINKWYDKFYEKIDKGYEIIESEEKQT